MPSHPLRKQNYSFKAVMNAIFFGVGRTLPGMIELTNIGKLIWI